MCVCVCVCVCVWLWVWVWVWVCEGAGLLFGLYLYSLLIFGLAKHTLLWTLCDYALYGPQVMVMCVVYFAIGAQVAYYIFIRPVEDVPLEERGWNSVGGILLCLVSPLPVLLDIALVGQRAEWVIGKNAPG
jgi:hypothetical protein